MTSPRGFLDFSSAWTRRPSRVERPICEEAVYDEIPAGFEPTEEFTLEEKRSLPNIDEFFSKKQIDPWRRMSALEHDCVMVVEFSELVGPKPSLCIPESPGAHFESNDFAVWLMTADYQASNHRNGPFFINEDIQMLLSNEEQGVHTYAHHFTLFDIEARGYVRPFCATYVTPDPVKLSRLFDALRAEFTRILKLVKLCNRRLFRNALTEAAEALNVIETQAISSYYELYYDGKGDPSRLELDSATGSVNHASPSHSSAPKQQKPDELNTRYRRLQRELLLTQHSVSDDIRSRLRQEPDSSTVNGRCGVHVVNMDQLINSLRRGDGLETRKKTLKELEELCPCVSGEFQRQLRSVWMKYRHWNETAAWFLQSTADYEAKVNAGSVPILYSPPAATTEEKEYRPNGPARHQISDFSISEVDALHNLVNVRQRRNAAGTSDDDDQKQLLVHVSPHLRYFLYPILTGQLLIAYGSDLRRQLIIGLIQKLKLFIPTIFSSPSCSVWNDDAAGPIPESTLSDYKLMGVRIAQKENINDFISENVKRYVALLDLNGDVFHVAAYKGDILNRLVGRASSHRSDWTLSLAVFSALSEYASLAYVFRYSTCNAPANDASSNGGRSLHTKKEARGQSKETNAPLKLQSGDMKIVRYLVELLKVQRADPEGRDDSEDALLLDYEPARWYKM